MFKKIVGLGFSAKGKNAKDIEKYIASLVKSGAGEFFVGYNPIYWHEKFGFEVSPNGRFAEHEQVTDYETLKAIVKEVHKHNLEIFANLNAWYYTPETMPYIEKMIDEFIQLGLDGIICGNISVLEYLKEIDYKGKINISTILALYNKEAIKFFLENYKINKIILSREVTLKEIENLVGEFPETKFEVFGEGDFCRYNNGLCFAEHKYGAKDICTVVVNDLIVKKRFRPDFKEIILDENKTAFDKIQLLDDSYEDDFETINKLIEGLELPFIELENKQETIEKITKLIKKISYRTDLYYDALKGPGDLRNRKIIDFLKILKFIRNYTKEFQELENEIESNTKSGISYYFDSIKGIGQAKVKAKELASFYAKGDNLNLYSYLFFSNIDNIDTVKFPTRGRNYSEKIKLIDEVLESGKVPDDLIDRSSGLERAHYDLTHLFGDKQWFRNLINKKS